MSDEGSSNGRIRYGEGRQALIEATVRLVALKGLSRLTTRTLTAEAGVSQGSLHHHFKSLHEILGAALDYCADVSVSYLSGPATFEAVFDGMLQFFRARPEVSSFRTEVFLEAGRRPELAEIVARHQRQFAQVMQRTLVILGIEPAGELVDLLMGAVDGFAYEVAVFGDAQLRTTERQFRVLHRLLTTADIRRATS